MLIQREVSKFSYRDCDTFCPEGFNHKVIVNPAYLGSIEGPVWANHQASERDTLSLKRHRDFPVFRSRSDEGFLSFRNKILCHFPCKGLDCARTEETNSVSLTGCLG